MSEPRRRRSLKGPLRWVAIFAGALLLGVGCCGLDAHLYPHAEFGGSFLAFLGFCLIPLSVLGLAISGLVLLVRVLSNSAVSE